MDNAQREFLERVANSTCLIALGKVGAGSVAAALSDIADRDRRIAELEAALKEWSLLAGHLGLSTEHHRDRTRNTLANNGVSAIDAMLAQAKREAIDRCIAIAKGCEDYGGGYREQDLEIYHHGMQTVHRCLMQLRDGDESLQLRMVESIGRRMAWEVKP